MNTPTTNHPAMRHHGRVAVRAGLSLVEVMMVLAIAGVLAAIASPRISGSMTRQRALSAAKRLASDIEYVRADAMASSAGRRLLFSPSRGMYSARDSKSPVRPTPAPYTVNLSESPYQSRLIGINFGNDTGVTHVFVSGAEAAGQVLFDGYGVPDTAGYAVVRCGDFRYSVSLDAAGRTSIAPLTRAAFDALVGGGGVLTPSGGT